MRSEFAPTSQTVDKPTHRKNAGRVHLNCLLQLNNLKYSQSLKMALRRHFCLLCQSPLNVPLYAYRDDFLVCVCFSTSAACRKILFLHAVRSEFAPTSRCLYFMPRLLWFCLFQSYAHTLSVRKFRNRVSGR